jgi:DNA-binding transcriptional LysR family regulator
MGSSLSALLGRLRFRHLALLAALGEHRNLHRAAAATHMSQPTATKVVREVELILGLPVFDRLPTGMRPTEFGVMVLEFANRVLGELGRLAGEADGRNRDRNGRLIIGMPLGVMAECVGRAIAEIKQGRPELIVKMQGALGEDVVGGVASGQMDLGVGYFHGLKSCDAVQFEVLRSEMLCVVARAHHALLRQPPQGVILRELERAMWMLHPMVTQGRVMEREFNSAGMRAPTNVVESDSVGGILSMVVGSDAVTMLPETIVAEQIRAKVLVRLPVAIGSEPMEFGVVSRRGEEAAPVVREYREALRSLGAISIVPMRGRQYPA